MLEEEFIEHLIKSECCPQENQDNKNAEIMVCIKNPSPNLSVTVTFKGASHLIIPSVSACLQTVIAEEDQVSEITNGPQGG